MLAYSLAYSAETLESVADHIFALRLLAILIDSEFEIDADINRVLKIGSSRAGRIIIGDITPYDGVETVVKLSDAEERLLTC